MNKVLVLGAGNIGSTIANLLSHTGDYKVTLADLNINDYKHLSTNQHTTLLSLDVSSSRDLDAAMNEHDAVISALPYHLTPAIAESAARNNCHYLDLTEDVKSTKVVKALAENASCAMIPQCGLAPGFISIAAYDIAKQFEKLEDVHMRVGALPMYPSNALKYNLTWSTEGLINEYCNPCEAIYDGKLINASPLEEIETFSLDGINYEAFNTSGGLGTLCHTLEGKVKNLNYRTVRYPGHRDVMKMLLQDLRLKERQGLLKEILETALPVTYQDVVLVFINVSGMKNGRFVQQSYANKIYSKEVNGTLLSAIQLTTASSVCAVLDMLVNKQLPQQGFIKQEDIEFSTFIQNRFGQYYAQDQKKSLNTEKNVA